MPCVLNAHGGIVRALTEKVPAFDQVDELESPWGIEKLPHYPRNVAWRASKTEMVSKTLEEKNGGIL